jgi:hypothetical protein
MGFLWSLALVLAIARIIFWIRGRSVDDWGDFLAWLLPLIALGVYLILSIYLFYAACQVYSSLEYEVIANDYLTIRKVRLSLDEVMKVHWRVLYEGGFTWHEEKDAAARREYEALLRQGYALNASWVRRRLAVIIAETRVWLAKQKALADAKREWENSWTYWVYSCVRDFFFPPPPRK